jgi:hypothetical protein
MPEPRPRPSGLAVAAHHPDHRGFPLTCWRGFYRPPAAAASVLGTWQEVPTE